MRKRKNAPVLYNELFSLEAVRHPSASKCEMCALKIHGMQSSYGGLCARIALL